MHEHTQTHSLFSIVLKCVAGVVSVAFAGSCVFGCYPVASPVLTFVSSGSFILGSHDKDDGPQLYMVDPSGISYVSYHLTNKSSWTGPAGWTDFVARRASNNARYMEWA